MTSDDINKVLDAIISKSKKTMESEKEFIKSLSEFKKRYNEDPSDVINVIMGAEPTIMPMNKLEEFSMIFADNYTTEWVLSETGRALFDEARAECNTEERRTELFDQIFRMSKSENWTKEDDGHGGMITIKGERHDQIMELLEPLKEPIKRDIQ